MTIEVDVSHHFGAFSLEAQFTAKRGLVALFGQSGSGKTTLINIIAGLIRPDRGRIALDGAVVTDTAQRVFIPPHRRRLGYVFQEDRLFPHLTVRQNLLYGSWFAGDEKKTAHLTRVVELLGIEHLLERRPVRLSGGEKQRVAIGRALLANPRLLLMDEPLASLDEQRKQEILPYLERLRDEIGIPIIYVSHSMAEVARLANTTVLLSEGRVLAVGSTVDLMQRLDLIPAAGGGEAGAVIECVVVSHDDAYGLTLLRSQAGEWRAPRLYAAPGTRLRMRIKARDVMIMLNPPEGASALNIIKGAVEEIGPMTGPSVDVKLDCNGEAIVARVTRYSAEQLALSRGTQIFAIIKSVAFEE